MKLNINGHIKDLDVEKALDLIHLLKNDENLRTECELTQHNIDITIAFTVNDKTQDFEYTLTENDKITPITLEDKKALPIIRHSCAHLMAQALLRLYPDTILTIGPAIENGFYYDVETKKPLTEADLTDIEKEMKKIVDEKLPIKRSFCPRKEMIKHYKDENNNYKVEILEGIADENVSLYTQGEFSDLCRGPHVPNTRYLKAFKLLSVAGAYWRGDEHNKMLTRIYGTAFANTKDLKDYLKQMEEAKKRDHRKLGQELDLFSFEAYAPGMPFFHPKGLILKNTLLEFMRELLIKYDYIEIETPTIMKDELWKISGHLDNYLENMFFVNTEDKKSHFAIKPMNCPGGMLYYKETKHSYRNLPLRVAEFGKVHRYERSGQLNGLLRVQAFTQDDAHIFMTVDQIEDEIYNILTFIDEVYKVFGFEYSIELSTRPSKSIGSDELWEKSTIALQNALERFGKDYEINEGDGAFYGPKIDFHLKDAIGRTHQCGTIQLDMNLPERFDIFYTGEDGKEHPAVILHRAIFGSIERFMAVLIEHYAGKFPVWLSPEAVRILTVSDKFDVYGKHVQKILRSQKIRATIDNSSEKLGYKIRKATMDKIPYILVVGENEEESNTVAVRSSVDKEVDGKTLELMNFTDFILEKITNKL